jgi:hypothetical protein
MAIIKRVFSLLALCFGIIGAIACMAALVLALSASSRLCRATDRLFEKLDSTVIRAQDRVVHIRKRVDASKITTESIEKSIKDWAKKAAAERVAVRLEVAKQTERLAPALQETGHWLELSGSACELVQQGLSFAASAGAASDPARIDGLIEDLKDLRAKIAEAEEIATRVRDWSAEESEKEPANRRIEQVAELAVRLAATLGTFDSRLDKLTDRLSQARDELQESKAKTIRRIRLVTIAVMLLIVWIGAGQVALAYFGCRGMGGTRSEGLIDARSARERH